MTRWGLAQLGAFVICGEIAGSGMVKSRLHVSRSAFSIPCALLALSLAAVFNAAPLRALAQITYRPDQRLGPAHGEHWNEDHR